MYKKAVVSIAAVASILSAEVHPRIAIMTGARYDNLRMCVATPADVKGGPMADAAFMVKISGDKLDGGFKIPLFRPIMFGLAFQMVQFEPEAFLRFPLGTDSSWTIMPGTGVSVHFGPDYHSDTKNRGESFWAAGPIASVSILKKVGKRENEIGLRPFVTSLFGENDRKGIVAGCSFEYLIQF